MWNGIKKILKQNPKLLGVISHFLSFYEAEKGTLGAQRLHREALAQGDSVKQGIAIIQNRWPNIHSIEKESPIFILSAGWRSGSTLLQRLIMSKENILVWGEPYSHAGMFDGLCMPVKAFTKNWPTDQWFIDQYAPSQLSKLWVANLYPDVEKLHKANFHYLQTLFKQPAEELGFSRWGIKDVRLTIDHAYFLKWLYPQAKFIFLYRNPYKAYMSYRPARNWYKKWPDHPVFTPKDFAKHWVDLLSGYIAGYKGIGGFLVKYEDLCSKEYDVKQLQDYLEIDLDASVLENMVGGSNVKSSEVPRYELQRVKKIVEPLASNVGYKFGDW